MRRFLPLLLTFSRIACDEVVVDTLAYGFTLSAVDEAIGAASDGDCIIIPAGYYRGGSLRPVTLDGLTLNGSESTMDGSGRALFHVSGAVGFNSISMVNAGSLGAIVAENASISLINCSFYNNSGGRGGAVTVIGRADGRVSLEVRDSVFDSNTGADAGAVYAEGVSVLILSSAFAHNEGRAGAVSFFDGAARLAVVTFEGNRGTRHGALHGERSHGLVLSDGLFVHNVGLLGGALSVQRCAVMQLSSVVMSHNFALRGGAMYMEGNASVTSVTVTSNSAADHGGGMYCQHCDVKLDAVVFSGNDATRSGGAIFLSSASTLIATNCSFASNTAFEGGGLSFSDSRCTLSSVTITNNRGHVGGGVQGERGALLLNSSWMEHNVADLGSAVYTIDVSSVLVDACAFVENDNRAMHVENAANLTFQRSVLRGNGGAIFAASSHVLIASTNITDNAAMEGGGGLFVSSSVRLQDVRLAGNSASSGGGMFLVGTMATVRDTVFEHNRAFRAGGGLFDDSRDALASFVNVTFSGNSALQGGGVFISVASCPTVNDTVLFVGNEAEHGKGIATKVARIFINTKPFQQVASGVPLMSLGNTAEIIIKAYDACEQSINALPVLSNVSLFVSNASTSMHVPSLHHAPTVAKSVCVGSACASIKNVIITDALIGRMVVVAELNGVMSGAVHVDMKECAGDLVDGVCLCSGGTKAAGEVCLGCEEGLWAHASDRTMCFPCEPGTYVVNGTCAPCPAGHYAGSGAVECSRCAAGSVSTRGSARCSVCQSGWSAAGLACEVCPEGADCVDGVSYAQRGYWRTSDGHFIPCAKHACPGEYAHGTCAPAHVATSTLCGECMRGPTGRAAMVRGACEICSPVASNVIQLLFWLLVLAIILWKVWVLNESLIPHQRQLANHLHMVHLLFELTVFHQARPLEISAAILMDLRSSVFRCLFDVTHAHIVFATAGVLASGTLLLTLAHLFSYNHPKIRVRTLVMAVVLTCYIHPGATAVFLDGLGCRTDANVLAMYPEISCDSENFLLMRVIALAYLAVFCVGLPACLFLQLCLSNKCSPAELELSKGYRPAVFFFEFCVMARKVLLILIARFFANSPRTQCALALLLLMAALVLHYVVKPYEDRGLNRIDTASLLVYLASVSHGALADAMEEGEWMASAVRSAVVVLNATFGMFLIALNVGATFPTRFPILSWVGIAAPRGGLDVPDAIT